MKDYIVMVSDLGDLWLSQNEAQQAAQAKAKNVTSISLHGNIYATSAIRGFLSPESYKVMYKSKRRSWSCAYGSAHQWDENCRCSIKLSQPKIEKLEERNELTPTQQQKADLRAQANISWIRFCGKDFARLKDKEERTIYIADYTERNGNTDE